MNKKVVLGISIVIIFFLIITMKINANTYDDIQVILQDKLGIAYEYGVFVEEFSPKNHNQTTFATNIMNPSDQWLSTWKEPQGSIFINKATKGTINLDKDVASKLILGQNYDLSFMTNIITLDKDTYVNINNCSDIDIYYSPNYVNITDTLLKLESKFTSNSTDKAKVELKDCNNFLIDISKCNTQVCYVNITEEQLNSIQSGALKITKDKEQIIVLNIKDTKYGLSLTKEYYVNGISSSQDNVDVADTVIWNLGSYKGKVTIGMLSGILVAPKADVELTQTCRGRLIANSFSNLSGEFHFISKIKEIKKEEETSSSTIETNATTETSSAIETSSSKTETTSAHIETSSIQPTTTSIAQTTSAIATTMPETTISKTVETTVATTTVRSTTEIITIPTSSVQPNASKDNETKVSSTQVDKIIIDNASTRYSEAHTEIIKSTTERITMSSNNNVIKASIEATNQQEIVKENDIIKPTAEVAADTDLIFTGDNQQITAYILIIIFCLILLWYCNKQLRD